MDKTSKVPGYAKKVPLRNIVIILLAIFVLVIYAAYRSSTPLRIPGLDGTNSTTEAETKVKKFESEADFKNYIQEAGSNTSTSYTTFAPAAMKIAQPLNDQELQAGPSDVVGSGLAERASTTNIQVAGIDEADIVKTDGKNIFYSFNPRMILYDNSTMAKEAVDYMPTTSVVKILSAFPPSNLEEKSEIDYSGNLLVDKNTLMVLSSNTIKAYDVSDSSNPQKRWNLDLKSSNYIVTSRLKNSVLYLVVRSIIQKDAPCPQYLDNGSSITISCQDIYHPIYPIETDSTYTVIAIDAKSGKQKDKISFIGSSGNTVVYVSTSSLYITYEYQESLVDFIVNFVASDGKSVIPSTLSNRILEINSYDITDASKLQEINIAIEKYLSKLSTKDRSSLESDMSNKADAYVRSHARDLMKTGIVKIKLDKFDIEATGGVPGRLLNQFSLDEYNNDLRLATTTENIAGISNLKSFNDIYVLNSKLSIVGSIKDLGLTERIYSARFVGDKGYLVTYRQTDPFYVLDLSDPKNPVKSGELKIPGYSSYLHPISDTMVLGIGEERSTESGIDILPRPTRFQSAKVSLFDVNNPENPVELDKYLLDASWSEVSNDHHAFLLDPKYKVFFIPADNKGYIFSYAAGEIKLLTTVNLANAKRAVFIGDYFYVIGESKIVVLNEKDWTSVNQLTF